MTIDTAALKADCDIVAVVGNYVPLVRRGKEFVGLCPFHADTNPSFYVSPEKKLWRCFSCEADSEEQGGDVIGFLQRIEGIDFLAACERLGAKPEWKPALSVPKAPPIIERTTIEPPDGTPSPAFGIRALGEPVKVYAIKNASGKAIAYECRYEPAGQKKEIRIWSFGHRGDTPKWGVGHLNSPRPLYGLDRLAERPSAPVLVTEGPKKADAGSRLLPPYASISITGGIKAWSKHDWEPLRGRRVLLWPDNDDVGVAEFAKLGQFLTDSKGLGVAARIIDPNRMAAGWDLADAENEGWTYEQVTEWAKSRVTTVAAPEPAPEPAPESPPNAPESPMSPEPPPEGTPAPPAPKTRPKPKLASVDGNTALAPEPEDDDRPLELSDDGIADYYAALHKDDFRYTSEKNAWFAWDGSRWKYEHNRGSVWTAARALARRTKTWDAARSLSPSGRQKLESRNAIDNFMRLVVFDRRILVTPDVWDSDIYLLGTPAGTIDLRIGKLIEATRDQHITKQTSVSPERGLHPLWDSVLTRATSSEPDMLDYLQRFAGYALSGSCKEECLAFISGPGNSGKSTFMSVLEAIWGDYAAIASMDALTADGKKDNSELADLCGARLVVASETREGSRFDQQRITQLTGRDKVRARQLYQTAFSYQPTYKIFITGNHKPTLRSAGEEMRRRLHMIEFPDTIPESERDNTLKDRLVAEYPAILQWAIDGFLKYQEVGLKKPAQVKAATDVYLANEDALAAWLDDNVNRDPKARTLSSETYGNFRRWAEQSGEYCPSQKRFSGWLTDRGFEVKRTSQGSMIIGLALRQAASNEHGYYRGDDQ